MHPGQTTHPGQTAAARAPAEQSRHSKNGYVAWLSWARVVGIVAIVTIHVFGHLVLERGRISGIEWHAGNLAQAASRFGVPLFVIVSGAALLSGGRAESLRDFYLRRASRVAIPLVVWTAFFLWFDRWMLDQQVTPYTFVQGFLWGRPYYHLYFLYVVAGLYLITPFLRVFVAHASRRLVLAATILCLTLAAADKLQHAYLGGGGGFNAFTYFVPWIGYYLLGYVVHAHYGPATRWWRWLVAYACAVGVTAGLTWWLYGRMGSSTLQLTYDYFVPTTVVAALAMVAVIRAILEVPATGSATGSVTQEEDPAEAAAPPLGRRLADLTLGVFLLHPIPLAFVRAQQPDFTSPWTNLAFHGLVVAGLLAGCGLVTYGLRRVPVIRRLV